MTDNNVTQAFMKTMISNRTRVRSDICNAIGRKTYEQLNETQIVALMDVIEDSWMDGYEEGDRSAEEFLQLFKQAHGRPAETLKEAEDWFNAPSGHDWIRAKFAERETVTG